MCWLATSSCRLLSGSRRKAAHSRWRSGLGKAQHHYTGVNYAMPALGQKATCARAQVMSGLIPISDIAGRTCNAGYVPKGPARGYRVELTASVAALTMSHRVLAIMALISACSASGTANLSSVCCRSSRKASHPAVHDGTTKGGGHCHRERATIRLASDS